MACAHLGILVNQPHRAVRLRAQQGQPSAAEAAQQAAVHRFRPSGQQHRTLREELATDDGAEVAASCPGQLLVSVEDEDDVFLKALQHHVDVILRLVAAGRHTLVDDGVEDVVCGTGHALYNI